ncbi:hypothetical protein ACHAWX_002449 [Stephanocyclus meneghinianus]
MNFISLPQRENNEDWHQFQEQPQPYYESLTGLLIQSGSSPTYLEDDESYKHHPAYGMDEDINGTGKEIDDAGRRHRLVLRRCRKRGRSCCGTYDSPLAVFLGLCGIFAFGSLLGLLLPSSLDEIGEDATSRNFDWDNISNVLGYSYFLSWTLSFYPQIITNCRNPRGAKEGVSFDFLVWNMIGFACYAAYVTSFLYSDVVRREYADRFGSTAHPSIVESGGSNAEDAGGFLSCSGHDEENFWFVGTGVSRPVISMPVSVRFTRKASILCMLLVSNHHSWIGYDYNQTKYFENFAAGEHSSNNNTSNSNNSNSHEPSNATITPEGDTSKDPIAVPQVKFNDVAFAWHALILSIITYVQIVWVGKSKDGSSAIAENISIIECSLRRDSPMSGEWVEREYDVENVTSVTAHNADPSTTGKNDLPHDQDLRKRMQTQRIHEQVDSFHLSQYTHKYKQRNQSISCATSCLILILLTFCMVGVLMVVCWSKWLWIDYLYFLSFVKVCISIVKYIPQAILNYQRKSTSGWQIWNILLDFSGGSLSIIQLIGDSLAEANARGLQRGWTGIVGNPAKFGLGLVSIFFDVVFMIQHYVLYRHPPLNVNENTPLDYPEMPVEIADYVTPLLSESEPVGENSL